jgi:hypothetical protein
MPTEKKLVAAAAFTRSQAYFFADQVENIRAKVERAQDELELAEMALERAIEKAREKQAEAEEAEAAASGIPVFIQARPVQFGVDG